ncbi:MAG: DEAD/DEAH box helicase family protein [Dehalococcoidia bacterium]
MQLRSHQRDMLAIMEQVVAGKPIRDIYASVTPGAGKSWLPVIAARALIPAVADKVCWVVPRKNLARQAEDVFARNAALQRMLPHSHLLRAAGNEVDPSRGLSGYVVTYQAIGMDDSGWHDREFSKHRYILVLDEPHHIADEAQWPERLAPLVQKAALRIFMSGTFERHDRQRIAFIPYKKTEAGEFPDLDEGTSAASASIVYTRSQAIEEGSIANLIFRRHDASGIAWETADGERKAFDSFASAPGKDAKSALWTALTRQYAFDLLERGLASWQEYRQAKPWAKLLIVAHNQARAQELHAHLAARNVRSDVAISNDSPAAVRAIDRFKGLRRPALDALVTVQMAYEGMDVPEISHVVCLTGIRSKPWLEQCFARAARVFPGKTHGYIWVPDDLLFRGVYEQILNEQAKAAYLREEQDDIPLNGVGGLPRPELSPAEGGGFTALDASVGAEMNSDMTGLTMTTRETEIFAALAMEEGVRGLAPIEVKKLVLEGQVTLGAVVTDVQIQRMRERYRQHAAPASPPAPPALRPSEEEQAYRDKITGWIRRHAYSRSPGDAAATRARRAACIRDVNTALLKAFGRRDRLPMEKLRLLWEHVQRHYPV